MKLHISNELLGKIHTHGEDSYPEEGAGLLLGNSNGISRRVDAIIELTNAREDSARHNRYLLLDIVGVFHSHPDHPNRPSEFDREWAMPWFSYIITSINQGKAISSRSWRLSDDREAFNEEKIDIPHKQHLDR